MLAASAALTDYQKTAAEFFNDKFRSIGFSALFLLQSRGLSLEQFVHLDFLLNTADHPEYPSASASFCAAHAQAARRFFESDAFGWSVLAPRGSSLIKPGITPAADVELGPWNTWTDFEQECGMSRFWGGVHFLASIPAGQGIGRPIGDLAYEFVQAHVAGAGQ